MIRGYSRISTSDGRQSLDLQSDALLKAGCQKIYSDKMSGTRDDRPGLKMLMAELLEGDTVVVFKLDRLGRSVRNLLEIIQTLKERRVAFKSLTESIDTSSPAGRLLLVILSGMASWEREIIVERTRAGLAASRARGRIGGRPSKLTEEQILLARKLLEDPSNSIASICRSLNIGKATFYRKIKQAD